MAMRVIEGEAREVATVTGAALRRWAMATQSALEAALRDEAAAKLAAENSEAGTG